MNVAEFNKQQKKLAADYRAVFRGPEADRVLANLSLVCDENSKSYEQGSFDRTAFNEGRRWVILHIRALLKTKLEGEGA